MELKPGYKLTEVGVIPEDWDATLVEDISEVKSGKRLPLGSSLTDKVTPYPYIRVADMEIGTVNFSEIKYVPENIFPAIKNYRIFIDDIFISVAGTLGIVGKIPHQLDGANLTENTDRLTNIQCNRDYLMYLLMSPLIQSSIESERTLGAQPKLALTRIRKFRIPLPQTKAEQTAIANALSDADALIQSLTHLIAKKRQIKQGAMQTLLNPYENGRLKEGWAVKRLGDIASFGKGKGLPKSQLMSDGKYECIHYGELFTKYKEKIDFIQNRTNYGENSIVSKSNDILMPTSDVTPNGLATASCLMKNGVILGGDILVIRSQDNMLDGVFFSYLVNIEREKVMQLVSGSTVYHLYGSDMAKFEFSMPVAIEEQTRIATILSDMDAEITALETKLAKYQHIKQGMMQNLLTGRIRLVKPESNTGAVA